MIYTLGYQGRTLDEIAALIGERGRLLDIRYRAWSKHRGWRFPAFAERFGGRYRHVPSLGNVRYLDGPPVQIADFRAGLIEVCQELRFGEPVFLMCGCRELAGCHRDAVSRLLRAEGLSVVEVIWPAR